MRTDLPPLLPSQWSSAYISYWMPMLPEDQLSSGFCWFDYARDRCRIDGMFNPWPERETGYRLWMSEIGDARQGRSHTLKVAYGHAETAQGMQLAPRPLGTGSMPFQQLYLPRAVLRERDARYAGRHEVLGTAVDAWTYVLPEQAAVTLYCKVGTGLLLRMVCGDITRHAAVRDFPNLSTEVIPDWVFAT